MFKNKTLQRIEAYCKDARNSNFKTVEEIEDIKFKINTDTSVEEITKKITETELNINSKLDIFIQQTNSLMNKQELLLKAINEDRLIITKILEHMEKLENKIYNRKLSNRSNKTNTTKSSSKRKNK